MSTQIISFDITPILIQAGYGVPNHLSSLGTEYTDLYTGLKYVNKDGILGWVQMLDITYPFSGGTSGGTTFTGGTVTGPTYFINGVTANTISATTYNNLPLDIRVTGGTYYAGTAVFKNNTGGTFNVSGYTYIPHLGYNNLNSTIWNYGFGGNVNNISFGENSLISNTSGEYNSAFGSGVLTANTTGTDNTGVGNYALNSNITGEYNTGIGSYSLYSNTSGVQNFGIGSYALYDNTTGSYNTGIGVAALQDNTVGERNVGIGGFSMYRNTGSRNIAIGFYAGSATKGSDNILFGANANNNTDGLVSGSNNTIIGTLLSGVINGSNNTIFGKPTGLSSTTTNNIVIADGSGNIRFRDNNINTILPRLAGSGNRMVIAGPNGELSSTTIFDTFVTGGTYSDGTAVFKNNTGGTFNVTGFTTGGTETTTSLGALINSAGNATPLDSDYVATALSGVTGILKKISWTNVKAFLKTYFDTLYSPAIYNITITSTININTETLGLNNSISYNQNGKNVMINNSGTDIIFSVNTAANTNFIASYTKLGSGNITFSAGTASLIGFPNSSPVVILDGLAGSTALLTRTNDNYYLLINNIYA